MKNPLMSIMVSVSAWGNSTSRGGTYIPWALPLIPLEFVWLPSLVGIPIPPRSAHAATPATRQRQAAMEIQVCRFFFGGIRRSSSTCAK